MALKFNFQQVLLKTLIPTMNTLKDMAVLNIIKTDGKCAPEAKQEDYFYFLVVKGENESECFFARRCLHILTIIFVIFVSLFKHIVLDKPICQHIGLPFTAKRLLQTTAPKCLSQNQNKHSA